MDDTPSYECVRCGREFPGFDRHTEIVRRDFVEVPHPPHIERFCRNCWEAYVTDFLGEDFEGLLDEYTAT